MHRTKRRRLASSGSRGGREAVSDAGIWLDKLPGEVCERIALHLCRGRQTLDALALAKTSPVMRRAVVVVREHSLAIRDKRWDISRTIFEEDAKGGNLDISNVRQWISVMGEDLFGVDQRYLLNFRRKPPPRFILPIFSLPKLRVAEIIDHSAQVAAVARSGSIREVHVYLARGVTPKELIEAFSKLHLVKLKMTCFPCRYRDVDCPSPFEDPEVSNSDSDFIARSLPHLQSLCLICLCVLKRENLIWRSLPSLTSLKEVKFGWYNSPAAIPKEGIRFLSSRESVVIFNSHESCRLASLIGNSVSEIMAHHFAIEDPFTADDIRGLQNHTRLKTLCFKIEEGADAALPDTVEKLPELRKLDLLWARSDIEGRERCRYTSQFAKATPGVMLRTVQVAPKLSKLRIGRVCIALRELVGILKWTGRRLHVFETSVGDQEEAPFERLEILLLAAAEHNNELRAFCIEDVKHDRGLIPVDDWKRQGERVLARLRFLEKRAAYLWAGKLGEDIESMVIGGDGAADAE